MTSNQTMQPTAPLRYKLTHSLPLIRPSACPSMSHRFPRAPFSVFAMTPWISSRCPATLVRLKLVRCPHSLAPTLVVLPSMSLGPALHSPGSHTPAVLLFNACRRLSLSRGASQQKDRVITKLAFPELPTLAKVATFISFYVLWAEFERLVINNFGIWRHLPGYEVNCFCIWDAGVILILIIWAALVWKSRSSQ